MSTDKPIYDLFHGDKMHIDVFHDTVCPWCRIGKRHLQLALESRQQELVTIRYRSFFLNPDIPPEGYEFKPYMLAKGNGRMTLEDFFEAPRRMGLAVGLTMNFESITKAPNSLLSHRLIALAPEDKQSAVLDAIYTAYFEYGRDIGDPDVLLGITTELGLNDIDWRTKLASSEATDVVLNDVTYARQLGISGVQFLIFDQKYATSGAQPVETLNRIMNEIQSLAGLFSFRNTIH